MRDDELARLAGAVADPILILATDGTTIAANQAALRLIGPAAERGRALRDATSDGAAIERLISSWARSAQPLPAGLVLETADGPVQCRAEGARLPAAADGARMLVRLRPRPEASRDFRLLNAKVVELGRQVRRRRRAEARLESQLVLIERVARARSLEDSLHAIVEYVEAGSPNGALASILLVQDGRLHHGAGPSLPAAYNAAVDGLAIGPCVGSCGTAAHTRSTVVVSDIATDPLWRDFKDLALSHDLRACWSVPVLSTDGEVVATVAHYYTSVRQPDAVDRQLSELARHVVGIAIDRHRGEQLLQARADQLAEMNARKNEFLAMLGHELRNPLSSMVLSLESLVRGDETPEQRAEWLAILQRQFGLVQRLVDDLLDVSRVTQGKIELRRRTIDLRSCLGLITATGSEGDPQVRVETPERPVWVHGDPERLQQAIDNLVHNARKFTPAEGSIDVVLSVDGDQARLRVIDTGEGIDPAELPHVFELFSQTQRPLHRPHGGLGIGLTLVQSLVQRHGGTVEARSEGLGRGCEFEIRLPLCAAPAAESTDAGPPRRRGRRAPARATAPGSLDVLVVDDDVDSARLLAELLSAHGHNVRVAHDGPAAIEAVAAGAPDFIILDIGLPSMDGFEVARRMRRDADLVRRRCTVVALTGYGQPSDRLQAMEIGFDDFMVKPVDLQRLLALIRDHVARGRALA